MAGTKKVIEIDVKANSDDVKKLNTELEETSKSVSDVTKKTEDGGKKATKGLNTMGKAWEYVGQSLKATGIGLVVGLLAKLTSVLMKQQPIIDTFDTVMNSLSIVFKDFFALLRNTGVLQTFGAEVDNSLTGPFRKLAGGLGGLSLAFKQLLSGNFMLANKIFKASAEQLGGYAQEVAETGKKLTELNKELELLEIRQQGIIEQYDREAELLRQQRDNIDLTYEERINAAEELEDVLIRQARLERQLIDTRAEINQERYNAGLISEHEYKKELLQTEVDRAEIEARIVGFRTEQAEQLRALRKEEREYYAQLKEDMRVLEDDLIDVDAITAEIDREKQLSDERKRIREEEDEFINNLIQKQLLDQQEADFAELESQENLSKAKKNLAMQSAALASDLLVEFASLTDAESKRGFQIQKAASLAQATTSTVLAAIEAFKTAAASPITTAFPAYPFTQAAAAGAFGAVRIAKIASTQYGGGGGAAVGGGSRGGGGGSPNVQFNTVGGSGINQLNESIVAQNDTVRAYVVSSEVSSAQSLDRNRESNATFG